MIITMQVIEMASETWQDSITRSLCPLPDLNSTDMFDLSANITRENNFFSLKNKNWSLSSDWSKMHVQKLTYGKYEE